MGLSALKKIVKPFVKANPAKGVEGAASLFNMPYSLNKLGETTAMLGIAGVTGAVGMNNMANANKIGNITPGRLSDMTQNVGISQHVKDVQKGTKELKYSFNNHGATGDIVLALHNMR